MLVEIDPGDLLYLHWSLSKLKVVGPCCLLPCDSDLTRFRYRCLQRYLWGYFHMEYLSRFLVHFDHRIELLRNWISVLKAIFSPHLLSWPLIFGLPWRGWKYLLTYLPSSILHVNLVLGFSDLDLIAFLFVFHFLRGAELTNRILHRLWCEILSAKRIERSHRSKADE